MEASLERSTTPEIQVVQYAKNLPATPSRTDSGIGAGNDQVQVSTVSVSGYAVPESLGADKGTYQIQGVILLPPKPNPWKKYKGMYKDNPLFDEVLTILAEERKERMARSHNEK